MELPSVFLTLSSGIRLKHFTKPDLSLFLITAGIPLKALLRSSKFWLFGLGYLFTDLRYSYHKFLSTYAVQDLSFLTQLPVLFSTIGIDDNRQTYYRRFQTGSAA